MGIGSVNPVCSTTNGYSGDQDGNITVQLAGTGSITVSIVDELICLTIEGETEEFIGGNGVPSEWKGFENKGFRLQLTMARDSLNTVSNRVYVELNKERERSAPEQQRS